MRFIVLVLTMFFCAMAGAAQDTCKDRYTPQGAPYYFCLPSGLTLSDKDDNVQTFVKASESGADRFMLTIREDSRINWDVATALGYDLIAKAYRQKEFSNVLLKEIGTVPAGEDFEAIRMVFDLDRSLSGKHVRRVQYVFSGAVKLIVFTFDIPAGTAADAAADTAMAEKLVKASLPHKLR